MKGNVLFLVLIAVALFAALSYAVTNSSRSSGDGISRDTVKLAVSEILQYTTQLNTGLLRMRLTNGCGLSQISFENPDYPYPTANSRSPATFECHMFRPEGGGAFYLQIQDDWLLNPSLYSSNTYIDRHGFYGFFGTRNIEETATIHADLVFVIPWLSDAVCDALNDEFAVDGSVTYGYWMGHYLGPQDFRTNDASNQKPFSAACYTQTIGDSRPLNTFVYMLEGL